MSSRGNGRSTNRLTDLQIVLPQFLFPSQVRRAVAAEGNGAASIAGVIAVRSRVDVTKEKYSSCHIHLNTCRRAKFELMDFPLTEMHLLATLARSYRIHAR